MIKKIYKYPTGAEIPEGAIYLNTVTQTQIRDSAGKPYETCFLVWHYFLVSVAKDTKEIIDHQCYHCNKLTSISQDQGGEIIKCDNHK